MNQWKGCLRCWMPAHRKHDKSRRTAPSLSELDGPQNRTPPLPRGGSPILFERRPVDFPQSPISYSERRPSAGIQNHVSSSARRPVDYRDARPVSPERFGGTDVREGLRRPSNQTNGVPYPSNHITLLDSLPSSPPLPLPIRSPLTSVSSSGTTSSDHARSLSHLLTVRPAPAVDTETKPVADEDDDEDYIPLNECYSGHLPPVPPPSRQRLNSSTLKQQPALNIPFSQRVNGHLLDLVIPPPTAIQKGWSDESSDEYMSSSHASRDELRQQYRRQQSCQEHERAATRHRHQHSEELPDCGFSNAGFDEAEPQAMYGSVNYQEQRFADMVNSRRSLWSSCHSPQENSSSPLEVRMRPKAPTEQRTTDRNESQYISMDSCSTPSGQSQLKDFRPSFVPIPAPRKLSYGQPTQPQSASVRGSRNIFSQNSLPYGISPSQFVLSDMSTSVVYKENDLVPEEPEYLFADRSETSPKNPITSISVTYATVNHKVPEEVLITTETNYDSLPDVKEVNPDLVTSVTEFHSSEVETINPSSRKTSLEMTSVVVELPMVVETAGLSPASKIVQNHPTVNAANFTDSSAQSKLLKSAPPVPLVAASNDKRFHRYMNDPSKDATSRLDRHCYRNPANSTGVGSPSSSFSSADSRSRGSSIRRANTVDVVEYHNTSAFGAKEDYYNFPSPESTPRGSLAMSPTVPPRSHVNGQKFRLPYTSPIGSQRSNSPGDIMLPIRRRRQDVSSSEDDGDFSCGSSHSSSTEDLPPRKPPSAHRMVDLTSVPPAPSKSHATDQIEYLVLDHDKAEGSCDRNSPKSVHRQIKGGTDKTDYKEIDFNRTGVLKSMTRQLEAKRSINTES